MHQWVCTYSDQLIIFLQLISHQRVRVSGRAVGRGSDQKVSDVITVHLQKQGSNEDMCIILFEN